MNKRTFLLLAVLVPFSAYSTWVLIGHGYMGIWYAGIANPAALQILLDLVIVCLLVTSWMIKDAPARGLNPWPFVGITLAAGSFGPLLYLLFREFKAAPAPATGLG